MEVRSVNAQPEIPKRSSNLKDFNFIFLHGIRVRSGTNYLGRFFDKHPHVQALPPDVTQNEFPLIYFLPKWRKAFESFNSTSFGCRNLFSFDEFLPYLGESWKKFIVDSFPYKPGHIFIKDPHVENLDFFFKMFPDSKLILLLRDGRDNVTSCLKATLATRNSTSWKKILKDRFNHYTMRSFFYFCKEWNKAVNKVFEFDQKYKDSEFKDYYMIIKYEDLVKNPVEWGEKLFSFCGADVSDEILSNLEEIEVLGSSFFGKSGKENNKTPTWTPVKPNEKFKPVGRWNSWNKLQKTIFKKVAGRQLIRAGYAQDLNW